MKLVKREPIGDRFRDRSGEITEHGIRVVGFSGFHGPFTVWRCICPKCSNEFDVIQTALTRQKSCGKSCPGNVGKSRQSPKLWRTWDRLKRSGNLAAEWHEWNAILDAVGHLEGKTLLAIDPGKPIGPSNFEIKSAADCGQTAAVYAGKPVTVKAAAKLLGVSRQRAAQLQNDGTLQHRLSRLEPRKKA